MGKGGTTVGLGGLGVGSIWMGLRVGELLACLGLG